MEEKKGQNTLYLVIGVATLVVAIIGATFAYFSAQASNDTEITGGTNDVSLGLTVNRVLFGEDEESESAEYKNLVPAVITLSTEGIQTAINGKCVANGYTGCHLYKIRATTSQDLPAAELLLQSFKTVSVTDKEAWKFVVFKATESTVETNTTYTVSELVTGTSDAENFANSNATKTNADEIKGYNIHKNSTGASLGMTANTNYDYYLLVYLGNKDKVQNPGEEDTENAEHSATGTYSGSVVFSAAGGKVLANFSSST